ncbi:hypothetical protein CGH25_18440 [Vibrio parahaemolyticus]|nr:CbrC family protein [Vibrio parahaemolyticus]TOB24118.1 hypothetical protein CGK11_20535 [Vibrio parahaemolyticus]TOL10625.1 hypothetical protein CGI05_16990 [Vibrio parahaemolyticus]TOO92956.1 hypothetical protein CGH25_18440 [Vibrio parahaemolyticus]TOQ69296.1 hypothetical protein CGG89_18440 [Vibrio parahaemolyticus]
MPEGVQLKFEFFSDTENFAFKVDEPTQCSVCFKVGIWFDAGMYPGQTDIECICDSCLSSGALIELDIEPNDCAESDTEDSKTITYKTPSLPCWQDHEWPFSSSGQYPVFERIASKEDFTDKLEFIEAYIPEDTDVDFDWLWATLPNERLKNYTEAGNVSVYLFSLGKRKYWFFDCN